MTTNLPSPKPAYKLVPPTIEPPKRGSRWTDAHTDFVIHKLGKNEPPSEIVKTLVQKYGCSWGESEQFVSKVAIQHSDKIKRKQRPLILLITLGTLLGAFALMAYSGMRMSDGYVTRTLLEMFGTGFLMLLGGLYGVYDLMAGMAKR
ncbi:MAG: hypothetical protein H0T73_04285 [Ardenticatenales bacterium]|nr:hypothetical protein [Ardenticatenales bacterium]